MLKERSDMLRRALIATDILLVAGAFFGGYYAAAAIGNVKPLRECIKILPLFVIFWATALYLLGMYESFRTKAISDIITTILEIAFIGVGASGILIYFSGIQHISRGFLFFTFTGAGLALAIEKAALMAGFRFVRRHGYNTRNN